LAFLVSNPLRLVPAIFSSSFVLIDLAIPFDAPLSEDFFLSPRFGSERRPGCHLLFLGISLAYN